MDRVCRRHAWVHWSAVLGVALELACAPEGPFVPVHDTGRLRIGTSFADALCGGELDLWEAHLAEVEQTLGVSRGPTWLYLYLDDEQEQIARDCDSDYPALLGCWRDPVVRSIRLAVPHELVHTWLDPAQPRALPVLREGIAVRMAGSVMFIGAEPFAPEEAGPLTLDDLLLDLPSGKYDEAGHLVAWMLATHGAEKFMRLYTGTHSGMSGPELSAAFLDILGQSTSDVLLAYETTARDYYPAMGGSACSRGPKVPWHDGAATWHTETTCAGGPLFGLESADQWHRVVVDVPTDGWYLLDPAGREASMTRCLTEPSDDADLSRSPWAVKDDWDHNVPLVDLYRPHLALRTDEWTEHELELAAGTYAVYVRSNPDETAEISLSRLDR